MPPPRASFNWSGHCHYKHGNSDHRHKNNDGTLTAATEGLANQPNHQVGESNDPLQYELQQLKANLTWFNQHPVYQLCSPRVMLPPPQPQTAVLLPAHGETNPLLNHPRNSQNTQIAPRTLIGTLPQVTLSSAVTQGEKLWW
ncbi:uncharacterized protein G2W53_001622 [Senna tora]|uniref:Uncharacterized protein n=1 Tax=Senna tora TaxID=362788 RepID=A0A834XIK9_9FABA|nr:uncharacterized protein G2W53_001622 [Senna tora]